MLIFHMIHQKYSSMTSADRIYVGGQAGATGCCRLYANYTVRIH